MLGDTVTSQIIAQVGLDKVLAAAITNNVEETVAPSKLPPLGPGPTPAAAIEPPSLVGGDITKISASGFTNADDEQCCWRLLR